MTAVDSLTHFGIPGMKWGKRKAAEVGETVKVGHRTRLEAGYLKKGMSTSDAVARADKRIKTEKILAVVGAVAVTAAVAYGAKVAIGKQFTGVVLEKGKDIHYINALGDKADFNRRLYTSWGSDTNKYRGLLAEALRKNAESTTVFDTVLRTKETIKAPSQHEAAKLFKEFSKDRNLIGGGQFGLNKPDYHQFNRLLVASPKHLLDNGTNAREFMDLLKSKGYNAILDSNDQFISGYNTKKPLILFNAASSTVKIGQSIVDKKLSTKLANIQRAQIYGRQLAPVVSVGAALIGGRKALDTHAKYGVVNKYILDHPNTKKTPAEIFNMVKEQNYQYVVVEKGGLNG